MQVRELQALLADASERLRREHGRETAPDSTVCVWVGVNPMGSGMNVHVRLGCRPHEATRVDDAADVPAAIEQMFAKLERRRPLSAAAVAATFGYREGGDA